MGKQEWTGTERAAEDHAKLSSGQVKRLKTVMASTAKSRTAAKTAVRPKRGPRASKVSAS